MKTTLVILGILAVAVGLAFLIDFGYTGGSETELELQEELDLLRDAAQSYVATAEQVAAAQNDALAMLVLYLWSVQVDLGSFVGLAPENICLPSLPLKDDYFLRVIEALAVALERESPTMTREFLVALAEQEGDGLWERYCGISAAIQDTREEADDAATD